MTPYETSCLKKLQSKIYEYYYFRFYMIKAAIFDFGGVLVHDVVSPMRAYYAGFFGVGDDDFYHAIKPLTQEWQKGKITEKELWQNVARNLKKSHHPEEGFWFEGAKRVVKENREMLDLVKDLHNRGYAIGLLSNTEIPVMHFIQEFLEINHPHFRHFDHSCVVGMVKPDREIYEHMLGVMRIKSQEAVFTDDKLENVLGARKVGMHAIHFQHHDQFKKDLYRILGK